MTMNSTDLMKQASVYSSEGMENVAKVFREYAHLLNRLDATLMHVPQFPHSEHRAADPKRLWCYADDVKVALRVVHRVLGKDPHLRSKAVLDVVSERIRQVEQEKYTNEHDDSHVEGELAAAGVSYASCALEQARGWYGPFSPNPDLWPWTNEQFKPKDQRSNLVRAAALLLAEIERIDRTTHM